MEKTLYRKMSILEVDRTLKKGKILGPDGLTQLPRKWFSTSLFRAHYFRNPYYNGENAIVKVMVNDEYFTRILQTAKMLSSEPMGFYGKKDYDEEVVIARAHKTIADLYNIGILDLDSLNANLASDFMLVDENAYIEELQQSVLGCELANYIESIAQDYKFGFYLQVPMDVAILMYKYQTLMGEGINPMLRYLYLLKDEDELEKINGDKFKAPMKVTMFVRFNKAVKGLSSFNPTGWKVNPQSILTLARYVEEIKVVDLINLDNTMKNYLEISGDNNYQIHKPREFRHYDYLPLKDYLAVSKLLISDNFKLAEVFAYIPKLEDMMGIMQVDPRDIDSVGTHTEKCILMSNLAINYFKNQGMEITSEDVIRIKWLLLLHDAGKPYCKGDISNRYSQFGGFNTYTDDIIRDLFRGDLQIDLMVLNNLMMLSVDPECHIRHIGKKLKGLSELLKNYYQENDEIIRERLKKLIKEAFICKVVHLASLKPRKFCAAYSALLAYLSKVNEYLINNGYGPLEIDEVDLDSDNMGAYKRIVEDFYIKHNYTTREMVLRTLQFDYNDLAMVYESKNKHCHHLEDESQLDYDTLIMSYFKDEGLVKEYFSILGNDNDSVHGMNHSNRVGVYNYLLGRLKNLEEWEIRVLLEASKYHDIGRVHDMDDTRHGLDSVRICEKENREIPNRDYVYFLMEAHCYDDKFDREILKKYEIPEEEALKLLGIFKDSDALDRVRYDSIKNYGSALKVSYLRNREALLMVKFAYLLNAVYKMKVRRLQPSVYRLVKSDN